MPKRLFLIAICLTIRMILPGEIMPGSEDAISRKMLALRFAKDRDALEQFEPDLIIKEDGYRQFLRETYDLVDPVPFQRAFPLIDTTRVTAPGILDSALGLALASELGKERMIRDQQLQNYLNQVAALVASNTELPGLKPLCYVLDKIEPASYTLPGAYIFLTKGLLLQINSEAELAFVLAHEIAHIVHRHNYFSTSEYWMNLLPEAMEHNPDKLISILDAAGAELDQNYACLLEDTMQSNYEAVEALTDQAALRYLIRCAYSNHTIMDMLFRILRFPPSSITQHYTKESVRSRMDALRNTIDSYIVHNRRTLDKDLRYNRYKAILTGRTQ